MFSEQQRKERTRMKEKSTIRYAGKEREREASREKKIYRKVIEGFDGTLAFEKGDEPALQSPF